ncbi:hypothetical protein OEZ86_010782 [Tetradesmus obliquus]|nr:hypothetical protein OEZ86_010782 [Tetradesmus obliquus]
MHYREHNFPLCHSMHRRPSAHSPVGSGRGGSGAVVTRQQEAQINRMAELPALIMQHVVTLLDHGSRLELRKADKRCRQMVDSCWRLVCVPLAQLRRHDMEGLARRFAATSCFVISEPEQRVSLSRLGHRRRCEHLLAVFLDNTAPWPHLVALDLSAAITSLSPASLELLAASLPGLQHLALPKVAASSEFAHAPAHEVLHLLGRLQQLRSLEFDCSFLQGGSSSAAASCITSPRLRGLRSLALVKVQQALFEQLLDPGQGSRCGKGLGQLRHLAGLTRLELGLQQPCSCKGAEALLPAPLIIPPHSTSDASSPTAAAASSSMASLWSAAPAAAGQPPSAHHQQQPCRSHAQQHTCCWSHLTQLRALVLSGVSLDCPLLAATADCSRLSELHVAGLQLEDDEFGPDFGGLKALKVLAVSQRFSMGGHCAAALFPGLAELSIRDDGSSCPDLSCLKHHSCLRSLAIEAGGPGWQLSSLQLAHLVHIDSLRQLSLASRGRAPAHAPPHAAAHAHGHGSAQLGGHASSPARSHPRLMSPGGGSSGSCNSHWLPTASLSQVTLLTLSGPCNDHTLSQLPSQFPGLVSLQLLGSYYASDWGLKRLCKAPQLSALLLDGCEHVTEYGLEVLIRGGGIKVLVVNECSGVDERACQRIRRACRNSCTCLHWHGTDDSRSSHGSHSSLSTSGSGYISPFFDSQASHSQQQQHHHHHHPKQQVAGRASSTRGKQKRSCDDGMQWLRGQLKHVQAGGSAQ